MDVIAKTEFQQRAILLQLRQRIQPERRLGHFDSVAGLKKQPHLIWKRLSQATFGGLDRGA